MLREQGRVTWVNRTLLDFAGVDADELLRWSRSPAPPAELAELFGTAEMIAITDRDGCTRWLRRIPAATPGGSQQWDYFIDITRETELSAAVEVLQLQDPATGVLNRRGILAALDKQVARTRRYGNPLAIIRLEFQPAAESEASAAAWCSLIQEVRAQLRWVDEVGRLDQRRVLLILPETDEAGADCLLEELRRERLEPSSRPADWTTAAAVTTWRKGDDRHRLLTRVGCPVAGTP